MPVGYPEELDKELAVTLAQFTLKPEIPQREQAYFQRFYVMFSKIAALGNIERRDVLSFKLTFKIVAILLEKGIYDYAHELMADFLMTLQLSRSIGGFWTLYGQQGVQRTEEVQRIMGQTKKSSLSQKVKGFFGMAPKHQEVEYGLGEGGR